MKRTWICDARWASRSEQTPRTLSPHVGLWTVEQDQNTAQNVVFSTALSPNTHLIEPHRAILAATAPHWAVKRAKAWPKVHTSGQGAEGKARETRPNPTETDVVF